MEFNAFYSWPIALCDAVLSVIAVGVYLQPLRHRENWWRWLPVLMLGTMLCGKLFSTQNAGWNIWGHLLLLPLLTLVANRCGELSPTASLYCGIWVDISIQLTCEAWLLLRIAVPAAGQSAVVDALLKLGVGAAFYLAEYITIARWMPEGGLYQIGPRQLSSAVVIGVLFTTLTFIFVTDKSVGASDVAMILLCQLYCASLLFFQTEMFKRSRMQKEIEVLNLLYEQERRQFTAARRNIALVNEKCLKMESQIELLQKYLPESELAKAQPMVQEARSACDAVLKTGNDALDIVLTEQRLQAEKKHIQLTCVADGHLLGFMEVADVYVLFSNLLGNAMEAVLCFSKEDQRIIDMVVHESQNFLVVNISNPLLEPLEIKGGMPVARHRLKGTCRGYGLRVVKQILEKYRGMQTIETDNGFFTYKILIPLPKPDGKD